MTTPAAGIVLLTAFVGFEARARAPMLPLDLFGRRNFAGANAQTFVMYGGMGLLGFSRRSTCSRSRASAR